MPMLLISPTGDGIKGEGPKSSRMGPTCVASSESSAIVASPESSRIIFYQVVTTWFLPRFFAS